MLLIRTVLLASVVMICCAACVSHPPAAPDPSVAATAAQVLRQQEVAAAARRTMETIRADLQSLGRFVPCLSGAADAPIVVYEPQDRGTHSPLPVFASLKYHRNVSRPQASPGPDGTVPAHDDAYIVGNGGIRLEVYLAQGLTEVRAMGRYPLPADFAGDQLYLYYVLEENPKSKDLEAAVIGLLERNVGLLREALSPPVPEGRTSSPAAGATAGPWVPRTSELWYQGLDRKILVAGYDLEVLTHAFPPADGESQGEPCSAMGLLGRSGRRQTHPGTAPSRQRVTDDPTHDNPRAPSPPK